MMSFTKESTKLKFGKVIVSLNTNMKILNLISNLNSQLNMAKMELIDFFNYTYGTQESSQK